jgi:hypothetical protein
VFEAGDRAGMLAAVRRVAGQPVRHDDEGDAGCRARHGMIGTREAP